MNRTTEAPEDGTADAPRRTRAAPRAARGKEEEEEEEEEGGARGSSVNED